MVRRLSADHQLDQPLRGPLVGGGSPLTVRQGIDRDANKMDSRHPVTENPVFWKPGGLLIEDAYLQAKENIEAMYLQRHLTFLKTAKGLPSQKPAWATPVSRNGPQEESRASERRAPSVATTPY